MAGKEGERRVGRGEWWEGVQVSVHGDGADFVKEYSR